MESLPFLLKSPPTPTSPDPGTPSHSLPAPTPLPKTQPHDTQLPTYPKVLPSSLSSHPHGWQNAAHLLHLLILQLIFCWLWRDSIMHPVWSIACQLLPFAGAVGGGCGSRRGWWASCTIHLWSSLLFRCAGLSCKSPTLQVIKQKREGVLLYQKFCCSLLLRFSVWSLVQPLKLVWFQCEVLYYSCC